MQVPPTCDMSDYSGMSHPCPERAEWTVIDKTDGKVQYVCIYHLVTVLVRGHTYSIFPARDYSKPADRIVVGPRCPLCDGEGHDAGDRFYCHDLKCRNAWQEHQPQHPVSSLYLPPGQEHNLLRNMQGRHLRERSCRAGRARPRVQAEAGPASRGETQGGKERGVSVSTRRSRGEDAVDIRRAGRQRA